MKMLTKRPERIQECLPSGWGDGWDNIFLNVTCEHQNRADERIPLLLELPFRHKGLHCAPLLGPLRIGKYLDSGQIEQVACGGENYGGSRPMSFELKDSFGRLIPKEDLYVPRYAKKCEECSFRILCNGCSNCGGCEGVI